jgi:hypothetical protein
MSFIMRATETVGRRTVNPFVAELQISLSLIRDPARGPLGLSLLESRRDASELIDATSAGANVPDTQPCQVRRLMAVMDSVNGCFGRGAVHAARLWCRITMDGKSLAFVAALHFAVGRNGKGRP